MEQTGRVDFTDIVFGGVKDTTHGIIKVVGVGGCPLTPPKKRTSSSPASTAAASAPT